MGAIFQMPAIVLISTVGGIIPLLRPANSVAGGRKKLKLLVFNIRGKPVRSLCGLRPEKPRCRCHVHLDWVV